MRKNGVRVAIFGQTPIKARKTNKRGSRIWLFHSLSHPNPTFHGLNREIMSKKEISQPAANFVDRKRQKQTFVTSLLNT